jgi:hypothetical protein
MVNRVLQMPAVRKAPVVSGSSAATALASSGVKHSPIVTSVAARTRSASSSLAAPIRARRSDRRLEWLIMQSTLAFRRGW